MEAVKTVLLSLLVFDVIIFVHELGHFIAARIFGVKINEFAIGMGPKLFSFTSKKSKTVYSFRAIPIGGFNSMDDGIIEQTDEEGNVTYITPPREELPKNAFNAKPVWQRMIIILAGSLMNLLLGFLVMTVVVLNTENYASTTIADFIETNGETVTYVEEFSGLKSGDKVIKVEGRRVHTGDELVYTVFLKGTEPIDLTVIRDGKETVIKDIVFPTSEQDGIVYGIRNFRVFVEKKTFGSTVKHVFFGSINVVTQVLDSLGGMLTGKYGIKHISGPIGVGEVIGEASKLGLSAFLNIAVVITMNLGVANLIPIPGLDGGKFVLLIAEAVMRKPIPRKIEETATVVGITLLMAFAVVVAFKDVFKLFM